MIKARQPYFDFLRGFAIIMVVGIHTITNDSPEFETVEETLTILLRLLLNCAVPLFLAISGYFIGAKKISTSKEHIAFLKKQIPKVYIPCLIFSIPYLLLSVFVERHSLLRSLAAFFLCGFSVYYFIALIIQYYILLPVFIKFNKIKGVILTFGISVVSIVIVSYLMKWQGLNLPLLIYAGPFPLWIVFFFMGVFFSNRDRNYSLWGPIMVCLLGFILQIVEYKFWLDKGAIALGIKLSSFIFSFGVVWLLFNKRVEKIHTENIIVRYIDWIGGISFGIYLLHCYMIVAINKILPGITWIEKWTLVLAVTILVIWIMKRLLPKLSAKYLGFR